MTKKDHKKDPHSESRGRSLWEWTTGV